MTTAEIQLNDPQTLYRRWEDSQWSPFAIGLSEDVRQWADMTGEDRDLIFSVLSSLMVAEERITTKFSGLVGAYGSEEEATFLSTQQVDEARHMQFYARFQGEVVASPETIAAHIDRARESVSDAFRHIFDEELVEAHKRLLAQPDNLAAKVRFITLYHLILEGTLGLTTFKFTTDYLSGEGLLPGFVEGYSKIHRDETRHIGYGVWYLREAVRAEPEMADVLRQTLRDLLPSVAASLEPPDTGSERDFAAIGASSDDIRAFALEGLTRRLDIIGVPLASLR
jgi:ribonucleoside-diphosphate reductase beta chain